EGGDSEDLFFAHEAHGFFAELVGVIDGNDACAGGKESARFTGGMNRYPLAGAGGFFDGSAKLGFRVLIGGGKVAIAKRVRARFINFYEIRAFLELLAYDGDELGSVIRESGVGKDVLFGVEAVGIFVAAEDVDGIPADTQARAGNFAVIDGVADGRVGGAGSFRAHVALGGETSHQVIAGGEGRDYRALGDGLLDGLQVFGAG